MYYISVTGTIDVDYGSELIIKSALEKHKDKVLEFNTGGAFGVDTIAARLGQRIFVKALNRLIYPAGEWYNKENHGYVDEEIAVAGGYMRRNDALVKYCDVLLAFPKTSKEVLRSGTWATVRRAKKARRVIIFHPLDGSESWCEMPKELAQSY